MFFMVSFFLQVGHFFCVLMAPWMQLWQNRCPQIVDVSSCIVSMHMAHFNLLSSSFSSTGDAGGSSFITDGSTGTFFRFRL